MHTVKQVQKIVRAAQKKGKTVVMANGCFDLMHVGHIRYLEGAKALGDILVVAINSDKAVQALKGPERPITPEKERIEILMALKCVDYVVMFSERTADKILLTLKPDIQTKGTDYTEENVPERKTVLSYGGRIAIVGDPKNHNTKDIIKKLKKK